MIVFIRRYIVDVPSVSDAGRHHITREDASFMRSHGLTQSHSSCLNTINQTRFPRLAPIMIRFPPDLAPIIKIFVEIGLLLVVCMFCIYLG